MRWVRRSHPTLAALVAGAVALSACAPAAQIRASRPPRLAGGASGRLAPVGARSVLSSSGPSVPPAPGRPAPQPSAPAFAGTVDPVSPGDVAGTYRPGCPVGPSDLKLLHMSYWGFDGQPHIGTMVVNSAVTGAVLQVFSTLYGEHFPIHQMIPEDAYGGSDPASMAADNTSGFNCRAAVAPGPPQWSVHAYGEAIDVNPVENPYVEGGIVQPPEGAPYLDRSADHPGEAVPGGELVQAFAAAGWYWGGRWAASPDYQHFSATGG